MAYEMGWSRYHEMVDLLYRRICDDNCKPNTIVGVGRGGAILGAMLSHKFDRPFAYLPISSYSGREQGNFSVGEVGTTSKIADPVILVDDLVDSGKTMIFASDLIRTKYGASDVRTAVLFFKPASVLTPTYYAEKTEESWIKFPYETE